jgi:hypothetical protein
MLVRLIFWLGLGWRGKTFAALCGLIGVVFFASVLLPYEPYESKRLEVMPTSVCHDANVSILTTREWRDTWYQRIEDVRVSTQWQDVETGARYPAFTGPTVPNWSHPTGTVKADIRLPVPSADGEYVLLLSYDIEGGILLAPRHQEVPPNPDKWLHSVNTLNVRDCR